ncbi:MAG TPA: hypothetical protein VM261_31040 [Kofleriaceae bacterium]|nr:hypothetical protein [Kofleriaceae bacterium]
MTTDIVATVRGDLVPEVRALLQLLAKKRLVPRIADAERFARESLVLLLRHEPSGVEVDLSMAWTQFEHEAIAAASQATFGSVRAPMSRPEDLIVFKSIAGRGKDLDDMTALLTLYPSLDHARLRQRVKQLAALAEEPALAAPLEVAIAKVAGTKTVERSRSPARSRTTVRAAKKPTKRKR